MKTYHRLALEALTVTPRIKRVESFDLYLDACTIHIWSAIHTFRVVLTDSKKESLKKEGIDVFLKWNEEAIYLLDEKECEEIVRALHAYIFNNKK